MTRESYKQRVYRAWWILLGIPLATLVLSWAGWLSVFESLNLDTWQRLLPEKPAQHVVIVGINDAEFEDQFRGMSPLDTDELAKLLTAVAAGHPAVIGVDLDTSLSRWREHYKKLEQSLPAGHPPIIWARDALIENGEFHPQKVLGEPLEFEGTGIALLPRSPDRVVREFQRRFPIGGGKSADSFHWAIVRKYCEGKSLPKETHCVEEKPGAESTVEINVMRRRPGLEAVPAEVIKKASAGEGWANGLLAGKIVLVGGAFRASRDMHATPIGEMYGIELLGHVIETELYNGGAVHADHFLLFFLDIGAGLLLIYIHYRLPLWRAMRWNLLAVPVLSLLLSLAAFTKLSLWMNFVPMTLGILLHELYDHAKHTRHLEEELISHEHV